jgi:hypothetical protein
MYVYMVVTTYDNGLRHERVFPTHAAAHAWMVTRAASGESELLELPVIGEMERSDAVFTLQWKDCTPDTHNVEAIYGNYRDASQAVGEHGSVLPLAIEVSANDEWAAPAEAVGVIDFHRAMYWLRQNRARRLRAAMQRIG